METSELSHFSYVTRSILTDRFLSFAFDFQINIPPNFPEIKITHNTFLINQYHQNNHFLRPILSALLFEEEFHNLIIDEISFSIFLAASKELLKSSIFLQKIIFRSVDFRNINPNPSEVFHASLSSSIHQISFQNCDLSSNHFVSLLTVLPTLIQSVNAISFYTCPFSPFTMKFLMTSLSHNAIFESIRSISFKKYCNFL